MAHLVHITARFCETASDRDGYSRTATVLLYTPTLGHTTRVNRASGPTAGYTQHYFETTRLFTASNQGWVLTRDKNYTKSISPLLPHASPTQEGLSTGTSALGLA